MNKNLQSYAKNFILFVKGPDRIESFHINADDVRVDGDYWYFLGNHIPIARFNAAHVIGYSDVPVFEFDHHLPKEEQKPAPKPEPERFTPPADDLM